MKNRFELKFIVVILNQLMTSQDEIKWNALWVGVGVTNGYRLIQRLKIWWGIEDNWRR